MISRLRGGSHDWVQQTHRSFEIIVLEFTLSTSYKLNFGRLGTRQHEHALLAQEAHTSPKSQHELNI
jgi:hypothetical protein